MKLERMKELAQFGPFLAEAERQERNGDFKKAFLALLAGAESGDSACQINLGNAYASGQGIRKNLSEAARWYKRAYQQGNRCGASNLAIDRQRQGNIRSAIFWFKRAVALGDGDACILLAKIYLTHRGARSKAIELLSSTNSMGVDDLSEAGREEVDALLQKLRAEQ